MAANTQSYYEVCAECATRLNRQAASSFNIYRSVQSAKRDLARGIHPWPHQRATADGVPPQGGRLGSGQIHLDIDGAGYREAHPGQTYIGPWVQWERKRASLHS